MLNAKRNQILWIAAGILTLAYGVYYVYGHWKDSRRIPELLEYVRSGNRVGVLSLLDLGIPSNVADSHGRSALMLAAERGDSDIVRALLDAGAKVDHRDEHGGTALMEAVRAGNADLVALLIFWKEDLNARSDDGATALKLARNLAAPAPATLPQTPRQPGRSRQAVRIVQMLEQAGARE
jgi:ankyrin repeat protein